MKILPGRSSLSVHYRASCSLMGLLMAVPSFFATAAEPTIQLRSDAGPLQFAAQEIRRAAAEKEVTSLDEIVLEVSGEGPAQSYRIERPAAGTLRVVGADARGTMYGGLDVAEAIRLTTVGELQAGEHTPYLQERGIKFNIPLDVRTPSYSDNSDAAQQNIPQMWDMAFWRTLLDHMARHRYNALTLWNLHPFPSIVKVPEYPDVALEDVLRGRRELFDDRYSHSGSDMFRPQLLEGAEVVKRMTIEEKIEFWREVMRYARDRGIDVYWFTWNAFLFGAEGHHGLTRSRPDENMIRYFRASVRETVRTYPLLAGIGITAGEHMGRGLAGRSKEQWLWETYGEGIRDALREQPQREFRLIHRFHQTSTGEILEQWRQYPSRFELSYKYAVAHMYSIPNPPFINEVLADLGNGLRSWLTVRNDDIYSFRWGDPEFARAFIKAMPTSDKVLGFYMGPDGYTWGRDYLTRSSASVPQTVIEKQWYSFLLWGRLAYDPELSDEHFRRILSEHFAGTDAEPLDHAWRTASQIFPLITRFVWGSIDIHWMPEACLSHANYRGFFTVEEFMRREPMPGSRVLSIRSWRKAQLENRPVDGTTPLQIADDLARNAQVVHQLLPALRAQQSDHAELRATLNDLEMFALLGDYYSAKLRAACQLALFDATADSRERDEAVKLLEAALQHWKRYAAAYAAQYQEKVLYNRVGWVSRTELIAQVEADIQRARQWQPHTLQ